LVRPKWVLRRPLSCVIWPVSSRPTGIEVRCFLEVALEAGGRNELQHSRRCVARVPESMRYTAWLEDQSTQPGSQLSFADLHPYLALEKIRSRPRRHGCGGVRQAPSGGRSAPRGRTDHPVCAP